MSERTSPADATDLWDLDAFALGPPHERFDELREHPLADSGKSPEGTQLWSVFRHADIARISRDTKTFSSHTGGVFAHPDQALPLELARNVLIYKDPPEHTKYRKILQSAFVPHSIKALEDDVRKIVIEHIDAFAGAGACDFVRDFAMPVPLSVLAGLLGAPRADIPRLQAWTAAIERAQISPEPEAAVPIFAELSVYLNGLIAEQKHEPSESLVTALAGAEVDGKRLTDDEILLFFGLLVFAGNDTTRNTMSAGMRTLLEHPEQLELLRAEPERIPNAVEEILRHTSVVNYFCRTATAEAEISGCPIDKGDKVVMWYAAGSRDSEANPDPHRLDVTREEINHMAFGGGGRHFCLGAGLARLEIRVAFEELFKRIRDIELAGEPELIRSNWAHCHTSLPIKFRPASGA